MDADLHFNTNFWLRAHWLDIHDKTALDNYVSVVYIVVAIG